MTLEAWVNPSTVNGSWRDVIYKGNDNYYLEATSTNASKPDAGLIAGGSYADAYGTAALPANTWSYLAETYDGVTLRLYVNGTQVASTAHTGAISTSTNPLQIGGDSIYGQYFAGMIDEVRVYNTALTATQIQTDQATPIGSSPLSAPGTLTRQRGEPDRDRPLLGRGDRPAASPATRSNAARAPAAPTSPRSGPADDHATRTPASLRTTRYSYRVRATDAAGDLGPYSNIATDDHRASRSRRTTPYSRSRAPSSTRGQGPGSGSVTWSVDGVAAATAASGRSPAAVSTRRRAPSGRTRSRRRPGPQTASVDRLRHRTTQARSPSTTTTRGRART